MELKTVTMTTTRIFIAISTIFAMQTGIAVNGGQSEQESPDNQLKTYQTKYYVIHTALDKKTVREAALRMTVVAEEYYNRTRGFSGVIREKLPFYLFSDRGRYEANGGIKGSAGLFTGRQLMALADKNTRGHLWHIIQHEAFHQFAYYMITPRLPIWANEGMAEYFGEGVWTGDDFITGVISPGRLKRVKSLIRGNNLLPFRQMLTMTNGHWNKHPNIRNYDQAWSMVHFLIHGDEGKYKSAFAKYIRDISKGRTSANAFEARFGGFDSATIKAFEQKYRQWWLDRPESGTRQLYIEAFTKTLTSFLARAHATGMKFEKAQDFFDSARKGDIKIDFKKHPHLWLPQSLLKQSLKQVANLKTWSLHNDRPNPRLILTLEQGLRFSGDFQLRPGKRPVVVVAVGKI